MGIEGEKTVRFWNGKQLKHIHIVGQTKKQKRGGGRDLHTEASKKDRFKGEGGTRNID